MLGNDIIIFANSYSCPLGKRCDDCIFQDLIKFPKEEIYLKIQSLENEEKESLVNDCTRCQNSSKMLKAGIKPGSSE